MTHRIAIGGYEWEWWYCEHGDYVFHDDHEAEVKALKEDHLAEVKALQDEVIRLQSLLNFDLEDCK